MDETLQDRTARHEGFRGEVYQDQEGNDTIGFGHKLTEQAKVSGAFTAGVTRSQALTMLAADLQTADRLASGALPWLSQLDEVRRSVVVEMVFQLGLHGTLAFHHALAAAQSGDWAAASQGMLDSEWHGQTPERCEELAGLMLNGTAT